jgi:hypothetical protein
VQPATIGETNRASKKPSSAIIRADVRRFGHVINKDGVLGTHSHHNATDQYDAAVCRWQQLIAATNGFINILHWPREATRGEASKQLRRRRERLGLNR